MEKTRINKKLVATIALILTLTLTIVIMAPAINAQIAVYDRNTAAYLSVNPPLLGLGQELLVNAWIYPPPAGPNYEMGRGTTGSGGYGGMHYENLVMTFTRPDGTKDTFMPVDGTTSLGLDPGQTEEVGTIWFMYTPNQIGTWSVSFSYPGQTFTETGYSVYYEPATSPVTTFTVQQDKVQIGFPENYPTSEPTGYWERPINAQNREWYRISGNCISRYINPKSPVGCNKNFNPYTKAPNSAHIIWKRPASLGGLIGGDWGSISYAHGFGFVGGAIGGLTIWNGRVYHTMMSAEGTQTICTDIRTGETIWEKPISFRDFQLAANLGTGNLGVLGADDEGEIFSGSATPLLWYYSSSAGWKTYDAWTGQLKRTIKTGITSLGSPAWLDGIDENVAFCLQQGRWSPTTMRRPFSNLIKWDMNKVTGDDWKTGVVWNVSMKMPDGTGPGEGGRGSMLHLDANLEMCIVTTMSEAPLYAFDMNTGEFLWKHDIGFPSNIPTWDPNGHYIALDTATMMLHSYDVSTWEELWSVPEGEYPWGNNWAYTGFAYGNIYTRAYDGYVRCHDLETGIEKWKFYFGETTETPFGTWAPRGSVMADGKIFIGATEHSPTQPRPRGNRLFAIDAFTGEEVWSISSAIGSGGISAGAVADGYYITANEYDGLLYGYGKGKTTTTVSASPAIIADGSSVIIQGTVMDMSPAQAGTPAISDASMTAWMEYTHMQMPLTADITGVSVTLTAIDPNGNVDNIGTVTSDMSGLFSEMWTPPVEGKYTIIAQFAGSESYWSSYSETAFGVDPAPSPAVPIEPEPTPEAPIITTEIAIIAAVAVAVVIGIAAFWALRKRK